MTLLAKNYNTNWHLRALKGQLLSELFDPKGLSIQTGFKKLSRTDNLD